MCNSSVLDGVNEYSHNLTVVGPTNIYGYHKMKSPLHVTIETSPFNIQTQNRLYALSTVLNMHAQRHEMQHPDVFFLGGYVCSIGCGIPPMCTIVVKLTFSESQDASLHRGDTLITIHMILTELWLNENDMHCFFC